MKFIFDVASVLINLEEEPHDENGSETNKNGPYMNNNERAT